MLYRALMATALLTLSATAVHPQTASSHPNPGSSVAAWNLARSSVGDHERWVIGSSTVTIEILDRRGEADRTMVIEQVVAEVDDALVITATPVATPGGGFPMLPGAPRDDQSSPDPDSPLGRMLSRSEAGNGTAQSQVPANPFAPSVADSVRISDTGNARSFGGVIAREYGIEWIDPEGSTFSGSICLGAETGAPVRLDVSGNMAEDDIREFATTISYAQIDGVTLPVRSITHAARRMNLFVTVRTRITVSYQDYFETDGTRRIILDGIPGQEE
jgi:hypothetical protein